MDSDIDIVVTWVDSKDPAWLSEYKNYHSCENAIRFESLDAFRYVFRGIEKFMPWVRKVHFITYGHLPKWLNVEHPKLNVVRHEEIFPDPSVLPVFSSNAIEMNFHRIKDITEKFIYFNDDMFVINHLQPCFYFQNNLPNDFFHVSILFHDGIFSCRLHNMMQIVNKEFWREFGLINAFVKSFSMNYDLKIVFKSFLVLFLAKEIPLLALHHHPQAHLKVNFIEFENKYSFLVNNTRLQKFRTATTLSQYIFRFWGLIKGRYNPHQYKNVCYVGVNSMDGLKKDLSKINKEDISLICFNEHEDFSSEKYSEYNEIVSSFLQEIMPDKSNWEL